VVALTLAIAGCGESKDSVAVDASPEGLARAASRTVDGESGRFTASVSLDVLGQSIELAIDGAFDAAGRGEVTMALGDILAQLGGGAGDLPPGLDDEVRYVVDGGVIYVCGALLELLGEDAECGSLQLGVDASTYGLGGVNDPTAFLRTLAGADNIEEVGEEDVDGVATTHLRGSFTMRDAIDALDVEQAEELEQQLATLGEAGEGALDTPMPFDVWLDGDGRVRRQVLDIDMSGVGGDAPAGSVHLDIRYRDFGDDVSIDVPDDAVDLTGLLPGS
jgi:hypothetical protein